MKPVKPAQAQGGRPGLVVASASNLLQHYNNLASLEEKVRTAAATSLVEGLRVAQGTHEATRLKAGSAASAGAHGASAASGKPAISAAAAAAAAAAAVAGGSAAGAKAAASHMATKANAAPAKANAKSATGARDAHNTKSGASQADRSKAAEGDDDEDDQDEGDNEPAEGDVDDDDDDDDQDQDDEDDDDDDDDRHLSADVNYALRRLIRGVASSREGARQGFALGLTLLLRTFHQIELARVVRLMDEQLVDPTAPYSTASPSMLSRAAPGTPQEIKDALFGRVFALLSILRSDRIASDPAVLAETVPNATAVTVSDGPAASSHARNSSSGNDSDDSGATSSSSSDDDDDDDNAAGRMKSASAVRTPAAHHKTATVAVTHMPIVTRIASDLIHMLQKKSYVREICCQGLILLVRTTPASVISAQLVPTLAPFLANASEFGPEVVAVSLALQRWAPQACDGLLGQWKHARVVHPANFAKLATMLAESTDVAHPRVHIVWQLVLDELTLPASQAASTKAGKQQKSGAAPTPSADNLITDFWTVVVEGTLFGSTHERKFLGFKLFEMFLARLQPSQVALVFTRQFIRSLITNAAGKHTLLHKAARSALDALVEIVNKSNDQTTRSAVLAQLLGKQGNLRFDSLTGTKTVERLIVGSDLGGVKAHAEFAMQQFLVCVISDDESSTVLESAQPTPADAATDKVRRIQARREWAIDQLLMIVRNGRIPKDEALLLSIARFLLAHGLFNLSGSGSAPFPEASHVPTPALTASTHTSVLQRFSSVLAELSSMTPPKEEGAAAPTSRQLQQLEGTMASGDFWVQQLAADASTLISWNHVSAGAAKTKTPTKSKSSGAASITLTPATEFAPEMLTARESALAIAATLHARAAELEEAPTTAPSAPRTPSKNAVKSAEHNRQLRAQCRAFELLFLHLSVLVLSSPAESVDILDELEHVYEETLAHNVGAKKNAKKPKSGEDEAGDAPNPLDVLCDIMISFLSKPSSLMRNVVMQVFRVFCDQLTETSLQLFLDVLEVRDSKTGESDLFELQDSDQLMQLDENDDGNAGDHEHDDSDDDHHDEDEEEGDSIAQHARMDVDRHHKAADSDDESVLSFGSDDEEDNSDLDESDPEGEVDDEFRRKILAALGPAASKKAHSVQPNGDQKPKAGSKNGKAKPVEPESDSSDEELFDDDAMVQFDEALARVFREKRNLAVERRDAKRDMLHLKMKVIDLLEIFIRKQSANPLVLDLILPFLVTIRRTFGSRQFAGVSERLDLLFKSKLSKIKPYPKTPALNLEHAHDILKNIMSEALHAPTVAHVSLCTSAMLLVLRVLIGNDAASEVSPLKTRGQRKTDASAEEESSDDFGSLDRAIVEPLLRNALNNLMHKKGTRLYPSMFEELIQRYPQVGWLLAEDLVAATTSANTAFRITQAYGLLGLLMKQKLFIVAHPDRLVEISRSIQLASAAAIREYVQNNEQQQLRAKHMREMLRFAQMNLNILKQHQVSLHDAFDVNECVSAVEALLDSSLCEQSTAVRSIAQQLLAGLRSSKPSESGNARASQKRPAEPAAPTAPAATPKKVRVEAPSTPAPASKTPAKHDAVSKPPKGLNTPVQAAPATPAAVKSQKRAAEQHDARAPATPSAAAAPATPASSKKPRKQ
ncbi:hypothetical protein CAOG_04566 [Capsaspora owczarzaki ATCC 30864]|uniref:DNA polymerase V n=1 Tax=Capsaspora owczarzaki (strain ATCC 30864) TaxID=595528 RepID=A0A0D2WQC0_CAPO3|nr:hypothetical protein CAOG_04566 [Capsaspora owczarzaki ATCC 30864]KJE93835.1 hypothetical protein CAOG_004566 [Capsaspora owczarzaki ATCC 30864]|eukprot:XP_004347313.1 hypothetical protein CAOG_04566 [Capsaspora owczarzaki ATCC 30864]